MQDRLWISPPVPEPLAAGRLLPELEGTGFLAPRPVGRGFADLDSARQYLHPKMRELSAPELLPEMSAAAKRVLDAIRNHERIVLYGDYDVDGTSSTAMVLQFLREIGGKVEYYIPDRFQEGYGLSKTSVKEARDSNASLIITVDVGITSYEPLLYAKQLGLDVIICDHHEPGETLPEAYAILDPLMPNNPYPFKHLAACGVAFKLIQAIAIKLNKESLAFKYLDYVAIASAADMVPLIGENRILASWGLDLINKNPRPGIKGLIYCTDVKLGNVNASNIVFSLAPLINAAGRLGDAKRSVEMMTQQNEVNAFRIAQDLVQDNR
jgi:single-stranded-DNA-specific exonuclease